MATSFVIYSEINILNGNASITLREENVENSEEVTL